MGINYSPYFGKVTNMNCIIVCKSTENADVSFVGYTFPLIRTANITVATKIKDKLIARLELIEQMMKQHVPKHICFKFIQYLIVSMVNYGPFIDYAESKG